MPWRRDFSVCWSGYLQASADLSELEMDQTLVLIEGVRDRSQPDKRDLADACRVRSTLR